MDKSIIAERVQYKIFGKVILERRRDYEGIDLLNVTPISGILLTDRIPSFEVPKDEGKNRE